MATIIASIGEFMTMYYDWWDSMRDPRVKHLFLMKTPETMLIIAAAYLLFVTKIGPKWMENKKPYDLKNVLIGYNIIQIIACSYIFYQATLISWVGKYKWFCEPVDHSMAPDALAMVHLCHYYYLTKILDLLDTIFFVLRKKNSHVTVLHLVHHTFMCVVIWFCLNILAGGSYTFFAYLNLFVHIIMYGYYLLAAMGPQVQKYLWWKKYLTVLQMGQFVIILLHLIPHFFIADCERPEGIIFLILVGSLTFLILFLNYYRMEYIVKSKKTNESRMKSKSS